MTSHAINVVAAFDSGRQARSAVQDLAHHGVPGTHVRVVDPTDESDPARVDELRAEMQEEAAHSVAGPAVGLFTPEQAKGASAGVLLGGGIGLAVGAVLGLIWASFDGAMSAGGRFLIVAVTATMAGAVIGFVAGGAMKPRLDAKERPGEQLDERRMAGERSTIVEVRAADEHEAELAHSVLDRSGAVRVDEVIEG
jgi:hypothetical protein